jgi:hypothetical protein
LLKAPFDIAALELAQLGCKQPAVAMDIVAVRTQAGKVFVDHRRLHDGFLFFLVGLEGKAHVAPGPARY